jgi:hypothetical protein
MHPEVAMQSVGCVQDVRHAPEAHTYGLQLVVPAAMHVPAASHTDAFSMVSASIQDDCLHRTPAGPAQSPDPLHVPGVVQEPTESCSHSLSGSKPEAIAPHSPFNPWPLSADVHA